MAGCKAEVCSIELGSMAACLAEPDADHAISQLLDLSVHCPELRLGPTATLSPALLRAISLAAQAGRLRSLSLGPAGLGLPTAGSDGLQMLLEALHATPLEALALGAASIDDAGGVRLAHALTGGGLPALRSLHLGINRLGPATARAIAGAATQSLHSLHLGVNPLGAEGAAAFAAAMEAGCTLRTLDFGVAMLSSGAAPRLFGALPRCAALETLRLGVNPLGGDSASHLAAAVRGLR